MSSPGLKDQELVQVGRITSVFGIKGWINVYSYTDPAENILAYQRWLLAPSEDDGQKKRNQTPSLSKCKALTLAEGQRSGKKIIARLDGYESRDQAVELANHDIFILKSELPDLAEGVYWVDLEGLSVIDQTGKQLGKIDKMFATGANDVMVLDEESGSELLIPYVEDHYVLEVNLEKAYVKVDWE